LAERKQLGDDELSSIVKAEIANSDGLSGSELANQRTDNLERFFAMPYGTEQEGRSSVISPDVRDAIGWVMPTLIRIFTSGERVCEFEPEEEGDIESAKQATEYVNFIWNRDNSGFMNFYTWFFDGLLSKEGTLKIYWNKTEKTKRERYSGLDDATFAKVVNQEGVTVSEHTEYQQPVIMPTLRGEGAPTEVSKTFHDLVITKTQKCGRVCVDPIPPEEYLISRDARTAAEARLEGHKRRRTLSDLIEEGYPKDKVNDLVSDEAASTDGQEIVRDEGSAQDVTMGLQQPLNPAMRQVWVYECYIKVDVDGDGIAEMRKVTCAGPGYAILDNVAWDAPKPFVSLTPLPLPHRKVGLALADITKIWQLLRTTILRQYLDNLYLSNNQREEVVAKFIVDPQEALSHKPGQKIRVTQPGSIVPIAVPQIGSAALEGLNYLDQLKENATGVSARTQGLGSNKLHDTARGEQMLMTAAMGKIELIARVYAETGVKEAFRLIHKLACMYQDQPRMVRLTGKDFVPVDPSQWNADMDMTVSVGLGTGDPERQLFAATAIGTLQEKLFPMGMVTPDNAMQTCEMVVNATGQKGVERFFTKPDPNAPPKPDPEMAKVQAQAEADKAKAGMDAQIKGQQMQQDAAMQAQSQQAEAALKQQAMTEEFALKRWQIEQEMALKREQLVAELQLKREQMQAELAMKERLGVHSANVSAATSEVSPGGEPG
jgi:hypothetical protein